MVNKMVFKKYIRKKLHEILQTSLKTCFTVDKYFQFLLYVVKNRKRNKTKKNCDSIKRFLSRQEEPEHGTLNNTKNSLFFTDKKIIFTVHSTVRPINY